MYCIVVASAWAVFGFRLATGRQQRATYDWDPDLTHGRAHQIVELRQVFVDLAYWAIDSYPLMHVAVRAIISLAQIARTQHC